ncbi:MULTISPECIES: c-type cytochrome [Roseateles]|uniref:C-type cytochrome n=1 Tax=Roseateles albus TaxID=2987525 RepID=A0ABT5K9M1_9BURK|nr:MULTISPECIES: c-type cytochrome [Roseateles]MCV2357583.1 c-type cytochrome [Paucibacter sp. TC2R-5]MDC8770645.1 c-type cytochrome [Roseateles albus]
MKKLLQISIALAASLCASASVHAQAQAQAPADAQAKTDGKVSVQTKVAMCIGCHGIPGYQASFPEIHKVPMIAGQNAQYIVSALNAYNKGERKHPTMRGIAQRMSERDMAEVAAFYEKQAGVAAVPEAVIPPSAQVAELLSKGACASCHGANFSKPIDGAYPKLAGQHADYLYVALKSYQVEGKAVYGRGNAIMAGQVKQFSHAELKAMANYLASLPSELRTVPQNKFR